MVEININIQAKLRKIEGLKEISRIKPIYEFNVWSDIGE